MEEYEKELKELEDAFSEDEELLAAKRRFEQSKLWQEHKKWHEQQGSVAQLQIWEEDRPREEAPKTVEVEQPKVQHIKVGGCECQPKFAFMQLEESGQVSAGIPSPVAEQSGSYNAASSTTTSYNAQGSPANTYNSSGEQKDLYR